MNRVKSARGESHKSPKVLHHLEVKEAENGGHVVTHHFQHGGDYHEPEEHVFGADQGQQVSEHIASAANIKTSEPSEAEGEDTGENAEA